VGYGGVVCILIGGVTAAEVTPPVWRSAAEANNWRDIFGVVNGPWIEL